MLAMSFACASTGMQFGFLGWMIFSWLALWLLGCMVCWLEEALMIRQVEEAAAKAELDAWKSDTASMEWMADEPKYQEAKLERAQRIMWSW
jgi:hypothetical protein